MRAYHLLLGFGVFEQFAAENLQRLDSDLRGVHADIGLIAKPKMISHPLLSGRKREDIPAVAARRVLC